MGETIEKRLNDLGIALPAAAAPAANYVPFVRSGNLLFPSGQLPLKDGKLQASGLLGRDLAEGEVDLLVITLRPSADPVALIIAGPRAGTSFRKGEH